MLGTALAWHCNQGMMAATAAFTQLHHGDDVMLLLCWWSQAGASRCPEGAARTGKAAAACQGAAQGGKPWLHIPALPQLVSWHQLIQQ